MRYRRGWNGMTEIVWDEVMDGNTVKTPEPELREKIIRAENFRPRQMDPDRIRRDQEYEQRKKEVELIRLTLQAVLLMAIFIMICLIDTAGMFGTVILMALIIGCSALMILLENKNER